MTYLTPFSSFPILLILLGRLPFLHSLLIPIIIIITTRFFLLLSQVLPPYHANPPRSFSTFSYPRILLFFPFPQMIFVGSNCGRYWCIVACKRSLSYTLSTTTIPSFSYSFLHHIFPPFSTSLTPIGMVIGPGSSLRLLFVSLSPVGTHLVTLSSVSFSSPLEPLLIQMSAHTYRFSQSPIISYKGLLLSYVYVFRLSLSSFMVPIKSQSIFI